MRNKCQLIRQCESKKLSFINCTLLLSSFEYSHLIKKLTAEFAENAEAAHGLLLMHKIITCYFYVVNTMGRSGFQPLNPKQNKRLEAASTLN